MERQCRKCCAWKPIAQFEQYTTSAGRCSRRHVCEQCRKLMTSAWSYRNRPRINKSRYARWARLEPEAYRQYRREMRRRQTDKERERKKQERLARIAHHASEGRYPTETLSKKYFYSTRTLITWLHAKYIKGVKDNGHWFISEASVQAHIERKERENI